MSKLYPKLTPLDNQTWELPIGVAGGKPSLHEQHRSFRLATDDETQIIVISPHAIGISQLPPYEGWDGIFGRFQRDWKVWKKLAGVRHISRLGVRYINRIDVPLSPISPGKVAVVEERDYLKIYPITPEGLGSNHGYGVQMLFPRSEIDGQAIINSAILVPGPIFDAASFLLDIDVSSSKVPQNDQEILTFIEKLRISKNMIFESCITDNSRKLFQ